MRRRNFLALCAAAVGCAAVPVKAEPRFKVIHQTCDRHGKVVHSETRIYNRVLSWDEMRAIREASRNGYPNELVWSGQTKKS